MARMKDFYKDDVAPALMKKFGYKSVMQIPKLDKIVINVGCGEAVTTRRLSTRFSSTWRPSPASARSSARPVNPSPTSSCAKA